MPGRVSRYGIFLWSGRFLSKNVAIYPIFKNHILRLSFLFCLTVKSVFAKQRQRTFAGVWGVPNKQSKNAIRRTSGGAVLFSHKGLKILGIQLLQFDNILKALNQMLSAEFPDCICIIRLQALEDLFVVIQALFICLIQPVPQAPHPIEMKAILYDNVEYPLLPADLVYFSMKLVIQLHIAVQILADVKCLDM